MPTSANDIANHFFEAIAAFAAAYAGWKSRQAKVTSEETKLQAEQIHKEVKSPDGDTTASAIHRLARQLTQQNVDRETEYRDLSHEIMSLAEMFAKHISDSHGPKITPSTVRKPRSSGGRGRSST